MPYRPRDEQEERIRRNKVALFGLWLRRVPKRLHVVVSGFEFFRSHKPKIRERLRSELKRPRDELAVDLIGTYTLDPDP
jgi:hypothetical protein